MSPAWLVGPGSSAVTRALLHFIWQGALIALVLAVLLEIFRRRSARFRYAAASGAMLAMLGAFGLTIARSWPQASAPAPIRTARVQMAAAPVFPRPPRQRIAAIGSVGWRRCG